MPVGRYLHVGVERVWKPVLGIGTHTRRDKSGNRPRIGGMYVGGLVGAHLARKFGGRDSDVARQLEHYDYRITLHSVVNERNARKRCGAPVLGLGRDIHCVAPGKNLDRGGRNGLKERHPTLGPWEGEHYRTGRKIGPRGLGRGCVGDRKVRKPRDIDGNERSPRNRGRSTRIDYGAGK